MKDSENKESGRYIPVAIRRPLLQECGYRCAVPTCLGTSALQFEHIEDWATLKYKNHDFDKMIVLCATCHARVTSKEIHKDAIKAYKRNLAIITGRYSLYEIRFLRTFIDYELYKKKCRNSDKPSSIKTSNSILPNTLITIGNKDGAGSNSYHFHELSRSEIINVQGLLDDEFVEIIHMPRPEASIQTAKGFSNPFRDFFRVKATEKGKAFAIKIFNGEEIE